MKCRSLAPVVVLLILGSVPVSAQRKSARGGNVTFAVNVTDTVGAPITDVKVTMTGPAQRSGRTEGGRLVFEGLPSGAYHFRFEKDGFGTIEKDVTGRSGSPVAVKVTMGAPSTPPKPIAPVGPLPDHRVDVTPYAVDLPTYIEKNYVGRSPGKATSLACASGGAANLLQINEPVRNHTHADSDEFVYVIAGQGDAKIGDRTEPMSAGVFLLVPRGTPHTFTAGPKKPLVILSILAGDKCVP
jgi:mannose-6-phosphate isomerase-like protein (cupin superfamily)